MLCDDYKQLVEIEAQLRMFAKIKELYNVDFCAQAGRLRRKADAIREALELRKQSPVF